MPDTQEKQENSTSRPCQNLFSLGNDFYDEVTPAQFPSALERYWNNSIAQKLGISLEGPLRAEHFARFKPLAEITWDSQLAMKYHGHQFMQYNPDLGDGRGFSFAQFSLPSPETCGSLLELGTKGSGTTPYSRSGDGRLTLKGAVREALCTEFLESLKIPTSKTLCFFETGEKLIRYDEPSPTRSAVLTRVSSGHIRIGNFQRLAYFRQTENIKKLLHYSLENFYPDLYRSHQENSTSSDQMALEFLISVRDRIAKLMATFMIKGFVHGVMNTDNINISGESFDYGPYRFLPYYDSNFVAAYFDHQGLYCFGRQPYAALWALHELGRSLCMAWPELPYKEALEPFSDQFNDYLFQTFFESLNLKRPHSDIESSEIISLFFRMQEGSKIQYRQILHDLHSGFERQAWTKSPYHEFYNSPLAKDFLKSISNFEIQNEQSLQAMQNLPTTAEDLLIEEIEGIWAPIDKHDDWSLFESKIKKIKELRVSL